ncbi:Maf family protein [Halomonas cupida]|uniref:Maf family protein n=1 Tax=Halomonas cupida TaxID=44933 RepID=UPI003A95013B
MSRIVLASSSPWRRDLLSRLGLPFTCASPDIDERPLANEPPSALVHRLALAKAQRLADDFPQHLIIGSDQVAIFADQILGKPHSEQRAREQLRSFSGQRVRFLTGLALIDSRRGSHRVTHEHYDVIFRQLSEAEIETYVAREQPLDSAGSFRMEGLGITLFERLEGDDPNTLIGLPLIRLCQWLREAGADPLSM